MKHFPTFDYLFDIFMMRFDKLQLIRNDQNRGKQVHQSIDPSFNSPFYLF